MSQSEDDTSDEEKIAEEDRRKDEEAKAKAKAGATKQLPSGASSKGTNTPSGRPKHSEPLKKNHLKRSGSPNLSASETSGNESARKKPKKKHLGGSSSQPPGTSTPRGMSPNPSSSAPSGLSPRKSSIVKLPVAPSKLSDIQSLAPNPAMSDGEMSDGARRKKFGIKLRLGGSTTNSRAGSPAVGSRAGSPALSLVQAQTNAPQDLVQAQGSAPSMLPESSNTSTSSPFVESLVLLFSSIVLHSACSSVFNIRMYYINIIL
jgi:transcription initiation factor TFIIF subunit alpha